LFGFIIFGIVMWLILNWSLDSGRMRTLNNRARRLTNLVTTQELLPLTLRRQQWNNFAQGTPESELMQVLDAQNQRYYPFPDQAVVPFPWPTIPWSQQEDESNVMFQGRHYRVLSRIIRSPLRECRVFIGGQLEDNRTNMRHFTHGLLWAIPVVLVLSGLSGYFISRRALKPIDRLIASVRSITIGNLSRRLPVSRTGDELARLAETCNEMLSRLEATVGQINRFTADASHELRSPLAYIRTVAECTLHSGDLTEEATQSFRDIVTESEHATLLLSDMLLLARSDSGHADTAFEDVDILPILTDVVSKITSFAEDREQKLQLHVGTGPIYIIGDIAKLRRLFWILIDNAIKYTPHGGTIFVDVVTQEGDVAVVVQDTGIGIPEGSLPRIFERFFRVDSARSYQEGTGLGLAIAKWICDIHMAKITVKSTEGIGTTFSVQFALAPETQLSVSHQKVLV
jgi:signal transduction histidine kinase